MKFLLKKESVFFFRGSALDYSGSWRGEMRTRFCQTIFWGKDLAKPRLTFVFAFVRAEEGSGEESARASLSDFSAAALSSASFLFSFFKSLDEYFQFEKHDIICFFSIKFLLLAII